MLRITKNNKKIKFVIDSEQFDRVEFNGENILPNNFTYKEITNKNKLVRSYKLPEITFNIIDDDIFGKTNQQARFSGKLDENINIVYPETVREFSMGEFKVCGHDH